MLVSRSLGLALSCAVFALFSHAASAGDGVLEINQACAVQTGCFANYAPGYPVTITAPGSYRLTSDLAVANPDLDGIELATGDVTLDLAGFGMGGPITCTGQGSSLVCGAGATRGIDAAARARVAVLGGRIAGFGAGIVLGDGAHVERLSVDATSGNGIFADGDAIIRSTRAARNEGHGFDLGIGAVVDGCSAVGNRLEGIRASHAGSLIASSAIDNGDNGIRCESGCSVSRVTSHDNGDDGVRVNEGGLVSDSAVHRNGDDGIQVEAGTSVQRNVARDNTGFGIALADSASYRENTLTTNSAGTVNGGINLGNNACAGSTNCP